MKKSSMILGMAGVLGVLILAGPTWSHQQAANLPYPSADAGGAYGYTLVQHGDSPARAEIGRVMNELRDAPEEKKADLTKQLEAAVASYFDDDMKTREAELTRLEERLSKLRSQLDRRRKAKADIVRLQIQVLANEAEGLGFSAASSFDSWMTPRGMAPMPMMGGIDEGMMGGQSQLFQTPIFRRSKQSNTAPGSPKKPVPRK